MAALLYAFAVNVDELNVNDELKDLEEIEDFDKIDTDYFEAVRWAYSNDLLVLDDELTEEQENGIRAEKDATRIDMAEAIAAYMELRDREFAERIAENASVSINASLGSTVSYSEAAEPVIKPVKPCAPVVPSSPAGNASGEQNSGTLNPSIPESSKM